MGPIRSDINWRFSHVGQERGSPILVGAVPPTALDDYFTDAAAWDLIASKLEEGHEVEPVQLREPPGRTGYVMKIELEAGKPMLYVKLELGSGRIFRRSFHYSER